MRTLLLLLAAIAATAFPSGEFNSQQPSPRYLKFRGDGTFQISIFEDLHFGENAWDQWGPQQDIQTVKVIEKVLDDETPDLVVLNGDLITGENAYLENATAVMDQIMGPMLDRGLPWASTFGNHDNDFNLSRSMILRHERKWENSMTANMFSRDGAGTNYFIPVYDFDCYNVRYCAPELLVWFFDSRGGLEFQQKTQKGDFVGKPNWVHQETVEWFRRESEMQARLYRRVIPSIGFVHIPAMAMQEAQRSGSVGPNTQPGINLEIPSVQADGWCRDGRNDGTCSYGAHDVPFMKAINEVPGFMALFSGHDHKDTWCYKWDEFLPGMTVKGAGINLCFGQHTGYGGYDDMIRGSRQVLLSKEMLAKGELHTWVRLEDGDIVGEVSLNSTYGVDKYPETQHKTTSCGTCNYGAITSMPGTKMRAWAAQVLGRLRLS